MNVWDKLVPLTSTFYEGIAFLSESIGEPFEMVTRLTLTAHQKKTQPKWTDRELKG